MDQTATHLFSRVPAGLFGPLAGPLASVYWHLLADLYEHEFEREPLYVTRTMALALAENIAATRIADVLANEEAAEDGSDAGDNPARAAARRLVRRLERSGWFRYEYRAQIGEVLAFFPYAARLLEVLVRVARDEQPIFQGYALSIATVLRSESFASKPGVALVEARRHMLELVRELKILDRNIAGFIQRILDEAVSPAGVLEESFERYRRAVMGNYHRLKTVDNLYKWRSEILTRLDQIERDELSLHVAARWFAEERMLADDVARQVVALHISLLRNELEKLPVLIDSIDSRNARFSGAALRKLTYLMRHDTRVEGQLQLALDALCSPDAPAIDVDVFRCELLGDSFLYTVPKRRARAERQKLKVPPAAAAAEAAALRARVQARVRRVAARTRIDEMVEALLAERAELDLSEVPLEVDEDYVRSIFIGAFGLDGKSPFTLKLRTDTSGRVRRGIYTVPRGRLVPRARSGKTTTGERRP